MRKQNYLTNKENNTNKKLMMKNKIRYNLSILMTKILLFPDYTQVKFLS